MHYIYTKSVNWINFVVNTQMFHTNKCKQNDSTSQLMLSLVTSIMQHASYTRGLW